MTFAIVQVPMEADGPKVTLRSESREHDHRNLCAYLDQLGDLHIDGHDLGPATRIVSDRGDYEWFETIKAEHIDRLIELLGGEPGTDILDLLRQRYTGPESYTLESILRSSGIPVERFVW